MTQQDFKDRLDFVNSQVQHAYELFEAYIYVYNKQASDFDTMNCIPGFFHLVFYSFLNQFATILSRLYDDHSGALSLSKLRNCFELTELDSKTKKSVLAQIDVLLIAQSENKTKLKILRNKALAHNDVLGIRKDIWTEAAKINIGEYRGLIETAYNIVCLCLDALESQRPSRVLGIEKDVDFLIEALKAYSAVE